MFRWLAKMLTDHYREVPLFWVNFDLLKYEQFGEENSCTLKIHPSLKDDEFIRRTLRSLVDYIRETNDLHKLV